MDYAYRVLIFLSFNIIAFLVSSNAATHGGRRKGKDDSGPANHPDVDLITRILETLILFSPTALAGHAAQDVSTSTFGKLVGNIKSVGAAQAIGHVKKSHLNAALRRAQNQDTLRDLIDEVPTEVSGRDFVSLLTDLNSSDIEKVINGAPESVQEKIAKALNNKSPKDVSKSSLHTAFEKLTEESRQELIDEVPSEVSSYEIPDILTRLHYTDIGRIYHNAPNAAQIDLARALTHKDAGLIVQNLPEQNLAETAHVFPKANVALIQHAIKNILRGYKSPELEGKGDILSDILD